MKYYIYDVSAQLFQKKTGTVWTPDLRHARYYERLEPAFRACNAFRAEGRDAEVIGEDAAKRWHSQVSADVLSAHRCYPSAVHVGYCAGCGAEIQCPHGCGKLWHGVTCAVRS